MTAHRGASHRALPREPVPFHRLQIAEGVLELDDPKIRLPIDRLGDGIILLPAEGRCDHRHRRCVAQASGHRLEIEAHPFGPLTHEPAAERRGRCVEGVEFASVGHLLGEENRTERWNPILGEQITELGGPTVGRPGRTEATIGIDGLETTRESFRKPQGRVHGGGENVATMQKHVRRLVNDDRCIRAGDESPQSCEPWIVVHRLWRRRLAASDDLASMAAFDATHAGVIVRVVIRKVTMSRREVPREPAGVQLIEGRGEPHEVVLRREGDDELSILIVDTPVDAEPLAKRLDGVRRPLEQRSVSSDLVGRKIAEDLEAHRAVTLKSGESITDLHDPTFQTVLGPPVHPDLDRGTAFDLIHRKLDESESAGGEQHDEQGKAHARVVGRKPRRLDGPRPILPTRWSRWFKCAVRRSDTSVVGLLEARIDRKPGARRHLVLSLVISMVATGIAVAAAPRPSNDAAPPHPARWESIDGPRVAVAAAAGVALERGPALIGGFTDRLEATAAIQVRDPRHGWMPVGSSLLEARAEATAIPMTDGTVLVIGGWSGRLPDDMRHLGTAERLDPWNPTTRVPVPAPLDDRADAGLEGHAACVLSDGRVLLVHGHRGTIFDPADDSWSAPFRMACERYDAALIEMSHGPHEAIEVLAIGGARREDDPPVETLRIDADAVTSTPWPSSALPATVARHAALRVGRSTLVAGGEHHGRSLASTWRLDPDAHDVVPGPDLPIDAGVAGGRLIRTGARVVLLGGESIVDGRPVPVTSGAVMHPRLDRVWPLPTAPASSVRATVLGGDGDSPEIVGGYRFDAKAARGGRTRVLADDVRLRLPSLLIDD
jgi:hypothetical protein